LPVQPFHHGCGSGTDSTHRAARRRERAGLFCLFHARFPQAHVLPAHSLCATVGRGGFAEAIRRTSLCADGRSNAICATFRDNEIELKAASEETGEAEEIIPADLSLGQAMEAGFNAKYLRDFLAVAPEGNIRIYFKDGRTQFEMRSAESRWTHRYVIMPMML
jgi:DNA polymerase III sliding clamp (beta) subunit (PCNA family)